MSKNLTLNEDSKYKVSLASELSEFDLEILLNLYQPLIGHGGIMFYIFMWNVSINSLDNESKTHQDLSYILQTDLERLLNYRSRLEGLGLLKTYYDQKKDYYLYELYSPLTPKNFFQHEILATLLSQKLPKETFDSLKATFIKVDSNKEGLEEITKPFSQVYSLNMEDVESLKTILKINGEKFKGKISLSVETNFDIEKFNHLLIKKDIDPNIISEEIINNAVLMSNLYSINEEDIANILFKISLDSEKIDLENFKKECFKIQKLPDYETDASKKIEDKRISIDKKIELFDEIDPFLFIKLKKGDEESSLYEKTIIEDLMFKINLNPGVVNVLIDYVMFRQENKIPRSYIMKIAENLIEKNVTTTKEAMKHFYRSNKYAYKLSGKNQEGEKIKLNEMTPLKSQNTNLDEERNKQEKLNKLKELRQARKDEKD